MKITEFKVAVNFDLLFKGSSDAVDVGRSLNVVIDRAISQWAEGETSVFVGDIKLQVSVPVEGAEMIPKAFPTGSGWNHAGEWIYDNSIDDGMTLRDYFAAKAIAVCPLNNPIDRAQWCYALADKMLEARK